MASEGTGDMQQQGPHAAGGHEFAEQPASVCGCRSPVQLTGTRAGRAAGAPGKAVAEVLEGEPGEQRDRKQGRARNHGSGN